MSRLNGQLLLGFFIVFILVLFLLSPSTEGFQTPVNFVHIDHFVPRTVDVTPIENKVPLTIYQSWQNHELPPKMAACVKKLQADNPEFDYYLFDDEESLEFIKKHFPSDVADAFKSLRPGAYKSDLWRYCVLYINGGVYMDIKYLTKMPLIEIVRNYPVAFVKDEDHHNQCHNTSGEKEGTYNGFMISPPKNDVFRRCIDKVVQNCKTTNFGRNSLDITGPCLLGSVLKEKRYPGFFSQLPFQFRHNPKQHIQLNGEMVLYQYPEYRDEQKLFQKDKHYGELYNMRQVYNTIGIGNFLF